MLGIVNFISNLPYRYRALDEAGDEISFIERFVVWSTPYACFMAGVLLPVGMVGSTVMQPGSQGPSVFEIVAEKFASIFAICTLSGLVGLVMLAALLVIMLVRFPDQHDF